MPSPTRAGRDRRPRRRAVHRGQVGPLGIVLLVGIVVLGTVAIVSSGAPALSSTRRTAELQQVQQAMTQFDARESMVALGGATVQSVALGTTTYGAYAVEPDAGWISVVHHDYDEHGANETIYNGSLGALVYRSGDTTIAMQGGGVWRSDGAGSVMISPPEFHYQAETLVLPIVGIHGGDSVQGSATAVVRTERSTIRVYPNRSTAHVTGPGAPYDPTPALHTWLPYQNPIQGGSVWVTVHSQFYRAWGRYLAARTEGTVHLDPAAETATVVLTAPRTIGNFGMPSEGNAIDVRGIPNQHAVDDFTITLVPDNNDAARFNNLQWSLYVKDGRQQFELNLRLTGPHDDSSTPCKEQDIAATVYYSDDYGSTYQGWTNATAFRTQCVDRNGDGLAGQVELVANLTGDTPLRLTPLSKDDLLRFSPGSHQLASPVTFDQHAATVSWEPITFVQGDQRPIGDLVNHYFGLLGPDYDLVVDDQNSNTVDESHSSGYLMYESHGRVTFMHITDDQVSVNLTRGGP